MLVHVTYVFGPKLPPNGRCPSSGTELDEALPQAGRGHLLCRRGLSRVPLEPSDAVVSGGSRH